MRGQQVAPQKGTGLGPLTWAHSYYTRLQSTPVASPVFCTCPRELSEVVAASLRRCRHAAETMSARDQRLRVDSLCIDPTARSRAWPRTAPRDPLQSLFQFTVIQRGRG